MPNRDWLALPLEEWRSTRDTLQQYCRIASRVRRALAPPQKHWWHVSLRAYATGLTTTPMPAQSGSVEVLLDLVDHALVVRDSSGDVVRTPLYGQGPLALCDTLIAQLQELGATAEVDRSEFSGEPCEYDTSWVERYWHVSSRLDLLMKQFRSEQRRETSPVQLWPHQLDWALSWFSGRHVAGADIADAEQSDEQMAFGFSTGDEWIPEPYLYVTAYPLPESLSEAELPHDAYWHSSGFNGAVMPYASLLSAADADAKLLGYWRQVHAAGRQMMDAD